MFQSADDQPWAEYREQITEVWFEDMEALNIPDLAYWFEGCTALTTAELPLAPTIGKHAFYNCPKLSTLTMYYGETVLNSIALSINGCSTKGAGSLTLADGAFPAIAAEKNLAIRYKAKVSASEAVTNINAATVIFTIAAVNEKEAA